MIYLIQLIGVNTIYLKPLFWLNYFYNPIGYF